MLRLQAIEPQLHRLTHKKLSVVAIFPTQAKEQLSLVTAFQQQQLDLISLIAANSWYIKKKVWLLLGERNGASLCESSLPNGETLEPD